MNFTKLSTRDSRQSQLCVEKLAQEMSDFRDYEIPEKIDLGTLLASDEKWHQVIVLIFKCNFKFSRD